MREYIGTIDQGTSSTRFMVFDNQGACVTMAQKEHAQICPKPGWVEHNAVEIWQNTLEVVRTALSKAGLTQHDLVAIGLTNQRETTLVWDRHTGEPLHNALVWQDTRVSELVEQFAATGGYDRFSEKTGLRLSTYFSSLKLHWLLQNIPGLRDRAERGDLLFGTMDSWLVWNLSGGPEGGVHLTDVTNASRTQLMNLATLSWDEELLRTFDIPPSILPKIMSSSEVYAEARIAPVAGVPIAGILGDQQAALVGQTCFKPGEAKNTYGTGCFLVMNTGKNIVTPKSGSLTTVAYKFGSEPPHYALEGSIAVAGSLVQWLRDQLGIIDRSDEVESLAQKVENNGDVYFVPAFSGLFAPHWQPRARGIIAGMTAYTNRSHIARAALEAVAYQTREVLEAMAADSGISLTELRVDGGMSVNNFLMQFQSDILDATVVRPQVSETTALGAAYAAGLAVGYWKSRDDLVAHWSVQKQWQSTMSGSERERLFRSWKKCVERSYDWVDENSPT